MTQKYNLTVPLLVLWFLIAALIFVMLQNPSQGIFIAATAASVFTALTGADHLHLL